jgi:hypothetical protein
MKNQYLVLNQPFSSRRSSEFKGCPVMGQVPVSRMYVKIVRFSNMCPVFRDTTGSTGGSPDIAQTCAITVRTA